MEGSTDDFQEDFMRGTKDIMAFREKGFSFYKAVVMVNVHKSPCARRQLKEATGIKNEGQFNENNCLSKAEYILRKDGGNWGISEKGRTLVEKVIVKTEYSLE